MENESRIDRKTVIIVILVLLLVALGILSYKIASSVIAKRANQVLKSVAFTPTETTIVVTQESEEIEETIAETETTNPTVEVIYDSPINFVSLQRINPDIYSWIEIPDTVISYPVLQSPSEWQYYINHTFDNQYNTNGSIFSQNITRQDYTDNVTILYGHNLLSREMFGSLKDYRSEEYMREHREITIYIPTETLTYTVFAAVNYSDVLITSAYDLDTPEGVQDFLNSVYEREGINNIILDDVNVTSDSHILVLSTCNGNSSQRFIVLAVLNEQEESEA